MGVCSFEACLLTWRLNNTRSTRKHPLTPTSFLFKKVFEFSCWLFFFFFFIGGTGFYWDKRFVLTARSVKRKNSSWTADTHRLSSQCKAFFCVCVLWLKILWGMIIKLKLRPKSSRIFLDFWIRYCWRIPFQENAYPNVWSSGDESEKNCCKSYFSKVTQFTQRTRFLEPAPGHSDAQQLGYKRKKDGCRLKDSLYRHCRFPEIAHGTIAPRAIVISIVIVLTNFPSACLQRNFAIHFTPLPTQPSQTC